MNIHEKGKPGNPVLPGLELQHNYADLPSDFYASIQPNPVKNPELVRLNTALANELGLDSAKLDATSAALVFSGSALPKGAKYLAMAYAGHQFGNFVPQLGDGRAALLGEVRDRSGRLIDIHLKGSGRTPFSRGGDGRAAIGPVVREYVVSEAMHALGIPTTRTLAITTTGEQVYRETALAGAVLARTAASHVRIGTFQFFAARGDTQSIKILADFAISRHYPVLAEKPAPYLALLEEVIERQAALVASWMQIGFIHGVMNTDNMTISGETIDYGPCAFMDHYDHNQVYSSIDRNGRYAYSAQAGIAQWNLARLAETLLPILDEDEARAMEMANKAIDGFPPVFLKFWKSGMAKKLGLSPEQDNDGLVRQLLSLMQKHNTDFTNTFRQLSTALIDGEMAQSLQSDFNQDPDFKNWFDLWKTAVIKAGKPEQASTEMLAVNPLYIPRNHLVEEAISRAQSDGDYSAMDTLIEVVTRPFDEQSGRERFAIPPRPEERVLQTFCGT